MPVIALCSVFKSKKLDFPIYMKMAAYNIKTKSPVSVNHSQCRKKKKEKLNLIKKVCREYEMEDTIVNEKRETKRGQQDVGM